MFATVVASEFIGFTQTSVASAPMVTGDRGPSRKPSLLESSTTSVGSKKGSARKSSKGSSSSGRTSPKRKKDSPRKQKGTELFPYKSFDSEWTHAKWKAESRQYHLREYQREISRRMRGAFSRRGASGSTSPHGDGKTLDETLAEAKAAPSEAPTGGAAPAYPAAKTRFSRETGIGYGYSHSAPSPPPEPAPSPAPAEVDPLNDPERPRLGERRPSMVGEMIEHLRTRSMSIAGQNPYGPPQATAAQTVQAGTDELWDGSPMKKKRVAQRRQRSRSRLPRPRRHRRLLLRRLRARRATRRHPLGLRLRLSSTAVESERAPALLMLRPRRRRLLQRRVGCSSCRGGSLVGEGATGRPTGRNSSSSRWAAAGREGCRASASDAP